MSPIDAALLEPNVQAFLKAIRLGEGTSDPDGYRRIVGGQLFDDFSRHPRVAVFLPRYKIHSTAAGAYQIIWSTWVGIKTEYGLTDFSPRNQDKAAVILIEEIGALPAVIAGKLTDAVKMCSKIWASLPGSNAGQRTVEYAAVQKAFIDAGGTVV